MTERRHSARSARHTILSAVAAAALVLTSVGAAQAQSGETKVKVIIEAVRAHSLGGTETEADFYSRMLVDGRFHRTPRVDNNNDHEPGWTFETSFPTTRREVPVHIELWDADTGFNGADNQVDISQADGRSLDLTLQFEPCRVTGQVEGACSIGLVSTGTADERASIRFRLEAETPASPENLFVRCLHSPLFPQPGDTVAITVDALDNQASATAARRADTVEIWFNNTSSPNTTTANITSLTQSMSSPVAAGTFSYGCRIVEDGVSVFSGWRTVQVGNAAPNTPVPVIYNGRSEQGVDIVFFPDQDDYAGIDAQFQTDVTGLLRNGIYNNNAYLRNQHRINVWLAPDSGQAGGWIVPAGAVAGTCTNTAPMGGAYSFADARGIVHRSGVRDCAGGGVFSGVFSTPNIAAHEVGHAPFGLADEYCCDGGYGVPPREPNIYASQAACDADKPAGATCRSFVVNTGPTIWTSDPAANDLMVDNGWANFLDLRRINAHTAGCTTRC